MVKTQVLCIFPLTCANIDMDELVPYGDNNVFRIKFKYPKLLRVNLLAREFHSTFSKFNNEGWEKNWCTCALAGFLKCVCFFSAFKNIFSGSYFIQNVLCTCISGELEILVEVKLPSWFYKTFYVWTYSRIVWQGLLDHPWRSAMDIY